MKSKEEKERARKARMERAAKFMALTREQQLAYVLDVFFEQARVATETANLAVSLARNDQEG